MIPSGAQAEALMGQQPHLAWHACPHGGGAPHSQRKVPSAFGHSHEADNSAMTPKANARPAQPLIAPRASA